jgi:two-component system response regulator
MEDIEILLVEDNINDAEMSIRVLIRNNLVKHIIHLKNGEAAIDFLFGTGAFAERNVNNKPKMILLDLEMPKVNGLEVLEKIKSDNLTRYIPVVMLTSSKEHPNVEKSYQLGSNGYIVKPIDIESFRKVVSELGIYWLLYNKTSS